MNDFRLAYRQLARSPGFTLVSVLTLAIGIGACTAIFSVVNRVLLQPLAYPHPDQLIRIRESDPPEYPYFSVAPGNFFDWQAQSKSFSSLAANSYVSVNLTGSGQPVRVNGFRVTQNYLSTLGARPAIGRDFLPGEDAEGKGGVAILGEGLWMRQFGGSPDIIGRVIRVDDEPVTVVGVMPREFHGQDIMLPAAFGAKERANHGGHYLDAIGRLKEGTTIEEATADLALVAKRLEKDFPVTNKGWTVRTSPLREDMVGYLRPQLYTLLGAVGFLLFIGCANVANLLLVRSAARSREMALRSAIGASRLRIVRQLVVENLVLSLLGGALGALLSFWGLRLLMTLAPYVPRSAEVRVDGWALAFSLGLAVLTGIGFGLVPAFHALRVDLNSVLKDAGRGSSDGRGRHRLRNALVVAELTIAVVLLTGAGLLMRSFTRIIRVDPGFRTDSAVIMDLSLPAKKYKEPAQQALFADQALERLGRIPGVTAAAAVQALPFHGDYYLEFQIDGKPVAPGDQPGTLYYAVTPGYFKAMGIPLIRGREFAPSDTASGPLVTIVSQSMAKKFFPDTDPIGKRVNFNSAPGTWSEIVGVVGDVRQYGLDSDVQAETYEPFAQHPYSFQTYVVRTSGNTGGVPAAMRDAILSVDREQPVDGARPLSDLVRGSLANKRFAMDLLAVFSAAALVLATLGIYGVMAYSVTQRTGEIGIRMALGAQPGDVLWLIAGQGARLIAIGTLAGLAGSLALTRFMASLLYGVGAGDPLTLAAASLTLAIAAFTACMLSARRATRIQPVTALRQE
jgi:putative ABC transport system permease protein